MAEYFGVVRPTHPRPLHNAISTQNEGSACRGAGRRSPVLPPGKVFWLGGCVMQRLCLRNNPAPEVIGARLVNLDRHNVAGRQGFCAFVDK